MLKIFVAVLLVAAVSGQDGSFCRRYPADLNCSKYSFFSKQPVCDSNGKKFDNICEFNKALCANKAQGRADFWCESTVNPTGMVTKPTSSPTGGSKCISMKITQIPASKTPLKQFFSKYINVFGVNIVATSTTPDNKVIHAANVLAQYLDNDEDGNPDNAMVVKAMVAQKATLIMFRDDQEVEYYGGIVYGTLWRQFALQDLYGSETVTPDETYRGRFDASLEEVLHLVTVKGYAQAYPSAWSRSRNSELGKAMIKQIADCGYAYQHSNRWPNCKGNFHYDDDTCDFGCLTHEYLYWGLTSILGAQSDPQRCRDISNEWELCTKDLVKTKDPALYALLTDPKYAFATKLPNGKYSKSC